MWGACLQAKTLEHQRMTVVATVGVKKQHREKGWSTDFHMSEERVLLRAGERAELCSMLVLACQRDLGKASRKGVFQLG